MQKPTSEPVPSRFGTEERRFGTEERQFGTEECQFGTEERHYFQSCVCAKNLDYVDFSTRKGVSDDVTDVTKHD